MQGPRALPRDSACSAMYYLNKNQCLYLKNMIKSGIIYEKDLIYEKDWLTPEKLTDLLLIRVNWISEYYIIRMTVFKYKNHFHLSLTNYVNIKDAHTILNVDKVIDVKKIDTKYLYNIYIKRNLKETIWNISGSMNLIFAIKSGLKFTFVKLTRFHIENLLSLITNYFKMWYLVEICYVNGHQCPNSVHCVEKKKIHVTFSLNVNLLTPYGYTIQNLLA